jgi:hypothetical protein
MGLVYRDEARLPEAENSLRAALAIQKQFLSPDHPAVASTLGNLGLVLRDADKLSDAEAAIRAALAARKKIFGDTHPSVAALLNDLNTVLALEHNSAANRE